MSAVRRLRCQRRLRQLVWQGALVCGWGLASADAGAQGTVAAPPASAFSAQVATDWFSLALQLTQQTPGFSPPVAARAFAYLGLALYESTVPGMPGTRAWPAS